VKRLVRIADIVAVPALMGIAYALLELEGHPTELPAILILLAFLAVVGLWSLVRELRAHATVARLAAVGDADELIEVATGEIQRRLTRRSKAPFSIYLALGHYLRGEWDDAQRALDAGAIDRLRPAWRLLAASTRVGVLVERGDAAGARRLYDRDVARLAARMAGPGARLLAVEAEARVKLAEGDCAEAAPLFARMSGDVRLGPATRAMAHAHAARCAEAAGDAEAAAHHRADAAHLAPGTFAAGPAPAAATDAADAADAAEPAATASHGS
jgi:hypothetical protein